MDATEFSHALKASVMSRISLRGLVDERHALLAFARRDPLQAANTLVELGRAIFDDSRAFSRGVGLVVGDDSDVDMIQVILRADGVVGPRLVADFAMDYDEQNGTLPRAVESKLMELPHGLRDADADAEALFEAWWALFERLHERCPVRVWSLLAEMFADHVFRCDEFYRELCGQLAFGDTYAWADSATHRADTHQVRAASEATCLHLTVSAWRDAGRDPDVWLSNVGRALPGCGFTGCCLPGHFERELEARGYFLRG